MTRDPEVRPKSLVVGYVDISEKCISTGTHLTRAIPAHASFGFVAACGTPEFKAAVDEGIISIAAGAVVATGRTYPQLRRRQKRVIPSISPPSGPAFNSAETCLRKPDAPVCFDNILITSRRDALTQRNTMVTGLHKNQ